MHYRKSDTIEKGKSMKDIVIYCVRRGQRRLRIAITLCQTFEPTGVKKKEKEEEKRREWWKVEGREEKEGKEGEISEK